MCLLYFLMVTGYKEFEEFNELVPSLQAKVSVSFSLSGRVSFHSKCLQESGIVSTSKEDNNYYEERNRQK